MAESKILKWCRVWQDRWLYQDVFFSRVGEKGLPFYHILRRPSNFEWTKEASVAFQQLKAYFSSSPLLVTPLANEQLYLYLVVMSKVLCALSDNKMLPIFYVSHVLNSPEERYSPLKKLLLNLIVTTRKLKLYFQDHPVDVLTNIPLGQVLHKLDTSERSSKWALELSEFHIDFSPRKTIQGQALADFLVECTLPEDPDDIKSHNMMQKSLTWILLMVLLEQIVRRLVYLRDPDGH